MALRVSDSGQAGAGWVERCQETGKFSGDGSEHQTQGDVNRGVKSAVDTVVTLGVRSLRTNGFHAGLSSAFFKSVEFLQGEPNGERPSTVARGRPEN